MKDFFKWLGVNEKVAKIAVWILIIMMFLIMTNTMLESIGFAYYRITYDNIKKINPNELIEQITSILVAFMNFYSITLLVFRVKEARNIFKYAVFYIILNYIVNFLFDYGLSQVFIALFVLIFSFFYSNKNWKYIVYVIISFVLNTVIQYIWFSYKIKLINYSGISQLTRMFLSLDFFLIMAVVIAVKEIIIERRNKDERLSK